MSEEIKGNAVADTGDEQVAQSNSSEENVDYKALYNEEIANSKKQRKSKQDFQAKYESLMEAQKLENEEMMIADGKLKEVIDAQKAELKSYKLAKEELDSLKASEMKSLLEKIPEDKREQYQNLDVPMLRNIVEDFYTNQNSNPQPKPGASRQVEINKPYAQMTEEERKIWHNQTLNNFKK